MTSLLARFLLHCIRMTNVGTGFYLMELYLKYRVIPDLNDGIRVLELVEFSLKTETHASKRTHFKMAIHKVLMQVSLDQSV